MSKIKASDYIVEWFSKNGVDTVFGYQGGMVTHIADSINNHPMVSFIQAYHEQSAAFAAVGYARYRNSIGVAIATSGPGATNMITAIADAFFDSVPVIFITGQVNAYEYKYDRPIRQLGFQETNVVDMVKPITKYAALVDKVEDIPLALDNALKIALSGRMGPVLLDLPMNVQREFINLDDVSQCAFVCSDEQLPVFNINIDNILSVINESSKPLVLIGGGVYKDNCAKEVFDFLNKNNLPFISSLHGKNSCDETSDLYLGTIGSYGNRCANMALGSADLLIVLGARLDVRQTGGLLTGFLPHGQIIQVDIDANELNYGRVINKKLNINTNIRSFIEALESIDLFEYNPSWVNYLTNLKCKYNQQKEILRNIDNSSPYKLMELLNNTAEANDIFCADVGQNQMWAMQMLKLQKNQQFHTSGGLGSMGSCLPIAVGIAFAKKDSSTVYAINGDGGLHMSLQSLLLISQYDLPIKVVLINNKALGMITQFQELYFNNQMVGTKLSGGYAVPNFLDIARSYNLKYIKVDVTNNREFSNDEFREFFVSKNCILEYVIDDCKVFPKLEFNQPSYNPSPVLPEDELLDNMLITSAEVNQ